MKVTYCKSDFKNTLTRKALISIIGDAKHGGFMRIHSFKSKSGKGEIQDTTYCKGISYKSALKKSLEILNAIQRDDKFTIKVTRGVWENETNEINPSGRKSKQYYIPRIKTKLYS